VDRFQIFLVPTFRATSVPGVASPAERAACMNTLTAVTYERLGDTVLVTGYLPGSAPVPQAPLYQQPQQAD
jgi:hypothetical protein